MAWNEARLHRWIASTFVARDGLAGGRGHDAVVLARARGRVAACVDATVEGVHVEPDTPSAAFGAKAAARALSDLAARAARPRALLLALGASSESTEGRLRALVRAVDRMGRAHGAPLVAGDLTARPGPLSLTVTALGRVPDGTLTGRDRARAGQRVVATGPCGGSRSGRHLAFQPRIAAGAWLHSHGATALMDVSDGLALDLARIADASGVRIELEQVPVHRDARRAARASGRTPEWHALHDGEDHELIATVSAQALARLEREAPGVAPGLVAIGRVRRGRGLFVPQGSGLRRWRSEGGFVHGA